MGGEELENEADLAVASPLLAGARLAEAPVLFFVVSHKAFRAELSSLRRVAVEAAECGSHRREVAEDLARRFEFLRLVYTYHCAAEDEVIFLALDAQVKNVVPTYALEHKFIDDNMCSLFHCLDILMKNSEDVPKMFQELLICISTIEMVICQHMLKEEEQVFPLLMQKFSSQEQAQLVWKYICSVPIIILKEFLPWMISTLSLDEQVDVMQCMKVIIPKEYLLQEVVLSWLGKTKRSSDACHRHEKIKFHNGQAFLKEIFETYPPKNHPQEEELMKACSVQTTWEENPIKGVYLWHTVIRRDFQELLEELYHIRSSNSFLELPSVILQLKFVVDALIFYSNSLDQFIYPVMRELARNNQSPCNQLIEQIQIESLRKYLSYKLQGLTHLHKYVDMLYKDLESFVRRLSENLNSLESEVFSFISKHCTHEMQLCLLFSSLQMMPLGLLRCAVTWFSAHLSENESKSILNAIKLGCPETNKCFRSLLCGWIRRGCSGKTSVEKFRKELQEIFSSRSDFLAEIIRPDASSSDSKSNVQPSKFCITTPEPESTMKIEITAANPSSPVLNANKQKVTSYSNGFNLHFSQTLNGLPFLQKNCAGSNSATTIFTYESRPMDHILFIHRALIKDMGQLVSLSSKMASNDGFLADFGKRFHLLHKIYKIHCDSGDEVAFPALEAKGTFQNISHSYTIDHKLELRLFKKVSLILNAISRVHLSGESDQIRIKNHQLYLKLHNTCISMHKILSIDIHRMEIEILPLFRMHFLAEEQEKIVGQMLGRIRADVLQELIPWLMGYLTPDEQEGIMSLWLKITKNTKFDEWLREWWDGMKRYAKVSVEQESRNSPSFTADPLEIISMYLLKEGAKSQEITPDKGVKVLEKEFPGTKFDHSGYLCSENPKLSDGGQENSLPQDLKRYAGTLDKKTGKEICCSDNPDGAKLQNVEECQKLRHQEHPLVMNQEELEATIRSVARDDTLDSQKKSYIIQNLLTSRWIVKQQLSRKDNARESNGGEIPGQSPSYRDPLKLIFGCVHYKRNCKLLASCCNKLYTCLRCHDDMTDHSVDRKSIIRMMCMKCLVIQPISTSCSTPSCNGFSMARYYCPICKLFEDERQIYHCPYCNLCRLGKGLGIDYFHCMKCNACMSRALMVHPCREKCLEENCPICHEYIFTSSLPVKALPCGHLMHSACFQEYTCSHYICPVCSKSLGDMQVYFGMLDALLAEEKIPEEYSGQTQVILCNDCEKRGTAPFHWLYHKCPNCGSYNTRLL